MQLFDTPRQIQTGLGLGKQVSIYVCGITPYDAAHVGHIFTFLAYDLLQRRLEDAGHTVRLVRNITDVDEPIYRKAAELGIDYRVLAARETDRLQEIVRALNFRPPYAEPRASQYIDEMADAVMQLKDKGFAYLVGDDLYFDTSRQHGFGSFSGFSDRLQLAFMSDRGGDPKRPGKRQPLDFLLWKAISDPADPAAWVTPLGRGRPGWHIECSVMSAATLGTPIDIHGGGMDLIFPHHECEIAQSTALSGNGPDSFAKHWMHVAPVLYQGEKMSKSLGNLVFAHDLLQHHDPAAVRLALMQIHYRTGGEWRHDALECAETLLGGLTVARRHPYQLPGDKYLQQIRNALDDDLDTHAVLHCLKDICHETLASTGSKPNSDKTQLDKICDLLGLNI